MVYFLRSERFPPPTGLEPMIAKSADQRLTCCATRTAYGAKETICNAFKTYYEIMVIHVYIELHFK